MAMNRDFSPYNNPDYERQQKAAEHLRRCRKLPPVQTKEVEELVQSFLASDRKVTYCPPRYLLPTA